LWQVFKKEYLRLLNGGNEIYEILFQMISGFKYRNEYINVIKSVNLMTQVTNNVHDSHIVKPQIKSNISDTSSGDLKQTK
jgi:hypothetical protein